MNPAHLSLSVGQYRIQNKRILWCNFGKRKVCYWLMSLMCGCLIGCKVCRPRYVHCVLFKDWLFFLCSLLSVTNAVISQGHSLNYFLNELHNKRIMNTDYITILLWTNNIKLKFHYNVSFFILFIKQVIVFLLVLFF